jgi:hypothetical protein
MLSEDAWFLPPTWNHEKDATVVFVALREKIPITTVMNITTDYLKSIGFHLVTNTTTLAKPPFGKKVKDPGLTVIKIDLVEKSFKPVSNAEFYLHSREVGEAFTTFPSHIPAFMETQRGRLMGKRFGL